MFEQKPRDTHQTCAPSQQCLNRCLLSWIPFNSNPLNWAIPGSQGWHPPWSGVTHLLPMHCTCTAQASLGAGVCVRAELSHVWAGSEVTSWWHHQQPTWVQFTWLSVTALEQMTMTWGAQTNLLHSFTWTWTLPCSNEENTVGTGNSPRLHLTLQPISNREPEQIPRKHWEQDKCQNGNISEPCENSSVPRFFTKVISSTSSCFWLCSSPQSSLT